MVIKVLSNDELYEIAGGFGPWAIIGIISLIIIGIGILDGYTNPKKCK